MLHSHTFQNYLFKADFSCSYEHSAHLLLQLQIFTHIEGGTIKSVASKMNTNLKLTLSEWYLTASNTRPPFLFLQSSLNSLYTFLSSKTGRGPTNDCPLSSHTPHSFPEQIQPVNHGKEKLLGRKKIHLKPLSTLAL